MRGNMKKIFFPIVFLTVSSLFAQSYYYTPINIRITDRNLTSDVYQYFLNEDEYISGAYNVFRVVYSDNSTVTIEGEIRLHVQIRGDLVELEIRDGFTKRALTIMYRESDRSFVSLQEKNILLEEYWRRFTR